MPLCSHKVDCWALGVTLYCFLYGSLPFFAAEGGMTALLDKIKEANPEYPDGVASTESVDLLKGLMSKDPEARLSLDGALAHPWLAGVEVQHMEDRPKIEITEADVMSAITSTMNIINLSRLHTKLKSRLVSTQALFLPFFCFYTFLFAYCFSQSILLCNCTVSSAQDDQTE